jgi:hypothetical protein
MPSFSLGHRNTVIVLTFKYILTVIDVLSKYAWAELIKTKTGENLVKDFAHYFLVNHP